MEGDIGLGLCFVIVFFNVMIVVLNLGFGYFERILLVIDMLGVLVLIRGILERMYSGSGWLCCDYFYYYLYLLWVFKDE